jgi:hypothetical protein
MTVTVLSNQSLLDIAVQVSGTVEAAFALAVDNEISVTDKLAPGDVITTGQPQNRDIADYYKNKNLKPATWMDESQNIGGIGYMNINGNFMVS